MHILAFSTLLSATALSAQAPAPEVAPLDEAVMACDAVIVADWVRLTDVDPRPCDPAGVADTVRVLRQSPLLQDGFFDRLQPFECDQPSGLYVFFLVLGDDGELKCARFESLEQHPEVLGLVEKSAASALPSDGAAELVVRFTRAHRKIGDVWDTPAGFSKLVAEPGFGHEANWPSRAKSLPVYFDFTTLDRASSGKVFSEFGNMRLTGEWRHGAFVASAIAPVQPQEWSDAKEREQYEPAHAPAYICTEGFSSVADRHSLDWLLPDGSAFACGSYGETIRADVRWRVGSRTYVGDALPELVPSDVMRDIVYKF